MRDRQWSGDRLPRNRIMLIAVPLIVTMAVGLIVGIRLVSDRSATLRLSNNGQRAANSTPAGPASPAPATPGGAASVSPSPIPAPAATVTPTATSMSCRLAARPRPVTAPGRVTRGRCWASGRAVPSMGG
ncbi:MAG TPA: hypothetical protein VMH35_03830 [Streptosporangiaceae bacterium]|nr:hypothetical protein [Streptosporangiaceae bacterium]